MKVRCIGTSTARCLLLTLRKTNILLDCGLWVCSGVLHKLNDPGGPPRFFGPLLQLLECYEIEAALISTPEGALALPHLLSVASGLIKGPIYATTAAIDAARHLASELASASPVSESAADTQQPGQPSNTAGSSSRVPELSGAMRVSYQEPMVYESCWAPLYSSAAADSSFEQIKAVRYGQHVTLDGYELTACPYPAGSGFGHAVWTISDGCRRIGYVPCFRLQPGGYALELEPQTLSQLDVLIAAPGCIHAECTAAVTPTLPTPHTPQQLNPQQLVTQQQQQQQQPVAQLQQAVTAAVMGGGSALVPLPATGLAWDVIEALAQVPQLMSTVPILYICPVARDSLALANTSMEFLSMQRQARSYIPEPAFPFPSLQASGRLLVASSLEQAASQLPGCFDRPCVVLASSASLVSGPARQLLHMWGPRQNYVLVLAQGTTACSPAVVADMLRSTHPGLRMALVLCDLGCPPHPSQLQALIVSLHAPPAQLVVSQADVEGVRGEGWGVHHTQTHTYGWMDELSIRLPKHTASVTASPGLLQSAQWRVVPNDPSSMMARLHVSLQHEQGSGWQLKPKPGPSQTPKAKTGKAATNRPSVGAVRQLLLGKGYNVHVQEAMGHGGAHETVLSIPSLEASIKLREHGAAISCSNISASRMLGEMLSGLLT